jgi:hypothetical protein
MGWWEEPRQWQMMIVAQMGGGAFLAAGKFFLQFRSAGLSARPVFLLGATGFGFGGSIGSAASVSYAEIVRSLRNPRRQSQAENLMWNDAGNFALGRLHHGTGQIFSAGGSVVVVGVQYVSFIGSAHDGTQLCTASTSLSSLDDFLNIPAAQGGFGAGIFRVSGPMVHLP